MSSRKLYAIKVIVEEKGFCKRVDCRIYYTIIGEEALKERYIVREVVDR